MTSLDDDIRGWLELAGPRPVVAAERMARARPPVHRAWREVVAERVRRRRLAMGLAGLAAAAAIAGLVLSRSSLRPPGTVPVTTAAHVASVAGVITLNDGAPLTPGDSVPTNVVLRVSATGRATLALVDGGQIRLDRDTSIAFEAARALRIDQGAVYVDSDGSVPTAGSPVRVRTPVGIVSDIGTRFEVRLERGTWHVRVRDGAIRFEGARGAHDAPAGRGLAIDPDGTVTERAVLPYGVEWSWATLAAPPFRVEGSTLAAFLAWVAAEGGRPVRFDDAALERAVAATELHGSIEGLTTDEALGVILTTSGLAHRVEGDRILVFKR